MASNKVPRRCHWVNDDPLYLAYHDDEWGVPLWDERGLFELILLEGAQAGLSWYTVLKKRENYRRAFDNFDPEKIARYDARKRKALMSDAGIIRNRLKIEAASVNARAVLAIRDEGESFADYLWKHVGGGPKQNRWRRPEDVPVSSPTSDCMSRELKRRGFKFVGSTICYAFMQASGMVNDHLVGCCRHAEVRRLARKFSRI
ncbi:MAG: DNA-3-methyladenine glycosylase I [Gammaproteobacteria bacterium]|nr:DNA-3-methyladenine glycosylase I [Gammaproteobacteria bacterium]MDH3412113.1 DNA-3-methyladenine glycosylase I [Gammaproteobacteria bacterium]